MSGFIANLAKSGIKVHSRYIARGRGALSAGGPQFNITLNFPLQSFIDRVQRKERNVLYASGRYALRTYRTQLRRRPPAKYTKTGRIRKRYTEEITDKAERPPYRRTGILYRSVEFVVDEWKGRFDSGPPLISGLSKFTKSDKPVPALLDQGGEALVRVGKRKGRIRGDRLYSPDPVKWETRTYRKFPYRDKVFQKTLPFFKSKLEEIEL